MQKSLEKGKSCLSLHPANEEAGIVLRKVIEVVF